MTLVQQTLNRWRLGRAWSSYLCSLLEVDLLFPFLSRHHLQERSNYNKLKDMIWPQNRNSLMPLSCVTLTSEFPIRYEQCNHHMKVNIYGNIHKFKQNWNCISFKQLLHPFFPLDSAVGYVWQIKLNSINGRSLGIFQLQTINVCKSLSIWQLLHFPNLWSF